MDIEAVGKDIVHGAIKVHSVLGPGLLESAYQRCLAYVEWGTLVLLLLYFGPQYHLPELRGRQRR